MVDASFNPTSHKRPLSRPRRIAFRTAAVLLGLLPFFVLEFLLRLVGFGSARTIDDPFVGFQRIHPLFVRYGDRYEIPLARQEYFRPESFAASKPINEFRIFCLGGSTVQGRPYAIETSFTTWLEISLNTADPARSYEVVNCGGVSYASYRLAPILEELLQYQPDLFVIYSGHNEFLEQRSYDRQRTASPLLVSAHRTLNHLRTYQLARSTYVELVRPRRKERAILPEEVDALLDYRGGLEQYRRDDAWTDAVMRHFEFNLNRMVAMARERDVPVVLVQPVVNLRDTPPFKFAPGDLPAEAKSRFDQLWQQAKDRSADPQAALSLLEQALEIDNRHAGAWFLLGKCYEALDWPDEARAAFLRACDEDLCPLRIRSPMYDAIARVAATHDVPLLDVRPLFEPLSPLQIPGNEVMLDHVHPTIEGHQKIALALLDEMTAMGLVRPRENWQDERKRRFREHLMSLDETYFARGKMRLEGLRMWSEGRSFKVRPTPGRQSIDRENRRKTP